MKKILILSNGYYFSPNTIDYAVQLAKKEGGTLYALVVSSLKRTDQESYIFPSDINLADVDYTSETDEEEMRNLEKTQTDFLENVCRNNNVTFSLSEIRANFLDSIVDESVFADLLICDEKSDEKKYSLTSLMAHAHCPVLVLPQNALLFNEIILAFDENSSSMHAIKQFTYLFSTWHNLPTHLVSVLPENVIGLEYKELLNEWLTHYYENFSVELLKGKEINELPNFINQHPRAIVVMGSFGRSFLSRLFKDSLANTVLNKTNSAVFITHN